MPLCFEDEIDLIITNGLREDLGRGDITSNSLIRPEKKVSFSIIAKEEMIVCGVDVVKRVFAKTDDSLVLNIRFTDGDRISAGDVIIEGEGSALSILIAERLSLNLLSFMSSISTVTNKYVKETEGSKTGILDTRKTLPNLRVLQKYAVLKGGGHNHRFGLYDSVLIKDNHISICGGIKEVLRAVKLSSEFYLKKIEIECDHISQVKEVLDIGGADVIMLDNMELEEIKEAVDYIDRRVITEVSGNVTLDKIKKISSLEVDFISLGCLTGSIKSVDIGLDIH